MTKVSIEKGLHLAQMCGGRMSSAYCELTIRNRPFIADLYLVSGYSSLDHMADVPLAAMAKSLSGKEFSSEKHAQRVAFQAGAKSLRGGPRVDVTLSAGRLIERWFGENLLSLKKALGESGKHAKLPYATDFTNNAARVGLYLDGDRYGSVRVEASDDVCSPDVTWTVSDYRYAV